MTDRAADQNGSGEVTATASEGAGRPAALILVMIGTFLALCVGASLLPHDPYIRYQQLAQTLQFRTEWNYDRINHDPTPIDIALVGVSRTQAGVSAPVMTEKLSERLGRPVHFVNLSIPQQGRNAHYVIARELLEKRPEVKVLVLSMIEQMPRTPHPVFRNIAETEDVLRAPILINYNYFSDLAFLPWRQLALFVQTAFPRAFGDRMEFDPDAYEGTDMDSTRSFMSPPDNWVDRDSVVPKAELDAQAEGYLRELAPPRLPEAYVDYEFAVERQYLREIGELAQANGTQIVFLFLPIYHGPTTIDDPAYIAPYGPMLTADFITEDPRLFSDYGHTNRNGSRLVTDWFADRLADMVEAGQLDLDTDAE